MQNFDEYNENRVFSHITRFFGRFTLDFILRILQTINHALAIGLGFLASAYVQEGREDVDTTTSLSKMTIMACLSILVSYMIEYVRYYSGDGRPPGYTEP